MKKAMVIFAVMVILLTCVEVPFAAMADGTDTDTTVTDITDITDVTDVTDVTQPTEPETKPTEPTTKPTEPAAPKVTAVKFSKDAVVVPAKRKVQLKLIVTPSGATAEGSYSSSDPDVAMVNSSGVVKGKKKGNAKITFKTKNGLKAVCTVTVVKASQTVKIKNNSLKLVYDKQLKKGLGQKIEYTLDKGAYKSVTFKSSNDKIATVTAKGEIVPQKVGKVKITVTAFGGAKAVCNVDVQDNGDVNNSLNQIANRAAIKYPKRVTRYVYGETVLGRPLEAYIIKSKKSKKTKVLFADFACHGFEDSYYRDGKVLVGIGNNCVEYYAKNPKKLGKYTLVIVPCANPDGTIAGKNNLRACSTAFGRCTAAHVDMNRDFGAFRGKESRALRDCFKKYPPDVYLNFHGWLNTSIGTPWLARMSSRTLGFSKTQTNWNAYGYIIRHVRNKYGASVCLVEYRSPSSAKRASGKTENFLNKIMR